MPTPRNRRWDTGTWLNLRLLADQVGYPLPEHPRKMTDTQHAYAETLLHLLSCLHEYARSADRLSDQVQHVSGNSPRHWLYDPTGFVNDITESLNILGAHQYSGWTLLATYHTVRTAIDADRSATSPDTGK